MKPLYLELARFGPYQGVVCLDFEHELKEGLFVVTGPTGAGKSTLFEAIFFALYGEATKKERGAKDYRSDFAKNDSEVAYVKLRFQVKNEVYEVLRTPLQRLAKKKGEGFREQKHEVVFKKIDDVNFSPLTRIDEVKAKIESLLGLSQEQFKKIIMLPQGAFQNFLLAETQEKKVILRTLFGTERYVLLQEAMKEKTSELRKTYESVTKEIELLFSSGFGEVVKDLSVALERLSEDKALLGEYQKALETIGLKIEKENEHLEKLLLRVKEEAALKKAEEALTAHLEKAEAVESYKDILKKMENTLLLVSKESHLANLAQAIKKDEGKLFILENALLAHEKEKSLWISQKEVHSANLDRLENVTAFLAILEKDLERARVYQSYQKEKEAKMALLEGSSERLALLQNKVSEEKGTLEALENNLISLEQIKLEQALCQQEIEAKQKTLEAFQTYMAELKAFSNLTNQKKKATLSCELAKSHYESQQEVYLKLKDKVFDLYRSELAKKLEKNVPCPVCGSTLHESPFRGESKVSLSDYEKIEHHLKEAQERLHQSLQDEAQLEHEIMLLKKALKKLALTLETTEESVKDDYEALNHAIYSLNQKDLSYQKALDKESELKKQQALLLKSKEANESLLLSLERKHASLKEEVLALKARLTDYQGKSYDKVQNAYQDYQEEKKALQKAIKDFEALGEHIALNETRLLTEKEGLALILKDARLNYEAEKIRFDEALNETFSTIEDYNIVKKELGRKEKISERIRLWETERVRLEASTVDLKERVLSLPVGDVHIASESLEALKADYNQKNHALGALAQTIEAKEKTLVSLNQRYQILDEVSKDYGKFHQLVKLVTGDNKWRMDFETFALVYYYDKVLYFANLRLRKMTDGRYYFIRQQETSDKRKQSGLGLDVMDIYTGMKRQVLTLSGGESFKASLALALGLSDVVREESGGIELDTIFIDEGFGTLDEDALDATLDTLMELEEGGRLVGIISHVAELKERIGTKLIVKSSKAGSEAYFEASSL